MHNMDQIVRNLDNLLSSEQYDEVLRKTQELLGKEPNNCIFYLFRGDAFRKKGMFQEALEALRQAIVVNPNEALARSSYASLLFEMGDLVGALNASDAGILIDPEFPDPYLISGDVLMEMGFPEEAVFPYNKAYEMNEDRELGILVATIYAQNNMPEEAIDVFSDLLSKNPDDAVLHFRFGVALLYALQNGASAEMIKGTAKNWREKYHDKPFVEEFSQELVDNHVNYNPLNEASVSTLFDSFSEEYNMAVPFEPIVNAFRNAVISKYGERSDLSIADLGCGTGRYAEALKPFASGLLGVDFSYKMLDKASGKKVYKQLYQANFKDFLSENRHVFDALFAVDVLDYTANLEEAFASFNTGLKQGGLLLLTLHRNGVNGEKEMLYPPFFEVYSEKFVKKVVSETGFEIQSCQEIPSEIYKNKEIPRFLYVLQKIK